MIELFRKLLPYSLVLYFLIRANKKPFFLLGIPFLMFMSQSIFFENAKPFQMPGNLYDHLKFIWLILLWITSKLIFPTKKTYLSAHKKLDIIDILIICLVLLSIVGFFTTYEEYYPRIKDLLDQFMIGISLFGGYFIIKDWIGSNNWDDLINLLFSVVCINTIAALLYIMHQGLHLDIYVTEEYLTESVGNQEITRSFWFMPQFLSFSIIFLLIVKNKYTIISLVLLIINLLAVVITYSVSSVVIVSLIVLLYYILTGLKNGTLLKSFRYIALFMLAGFAGLFIMSKILPANTKYLMSRFSNLSGSNYTANDQNTLEIRFANNKALFSKIDEYKKILGMGPVTENQISFIPEMRVVISDMVWAGIIFRLGYVGLILFIIIYLYMLFKTFGIFIKEKNFISDIALIFFLFLIAQILEGFVSWTFLSGHGLSTGLWYFAIISILISYQKNNLNPDARVLVS